MDTRLFDNCTGKKYCDVVSSLSNDWFIVNNDPFIHVFKHQDGTYAAIFACDNDGFIRFCDVQKNRKSIYLYNGIYQNIKTYGDIVFVHEVEKASSVKFGELPMCTLFDRKIAFRNVYRKMSQSKDPYSVPLFNSSRQWRTVADSDGAYCIDFIIIPDDWSGLWGTDREEEIYKDIEDFVYSTVGYDSPYAYPTGRTVTISWSFVKVPAGVAIVHKRGIDW